MEKAKLQLLGRDYEFPVVVGSEGEVGVDHHGERFGGLLGRVARTLEVRSLLVGIALLARGIARLVAGLLEIQFVASLRVTRRLDPFARHPDFAGDDRRGGE